MASESSEKTNIIANEVVTKETISKEIYENNCNGCGCSLPKILDRGICPRCGIRN